MSKKVLIGVLLTAIIAAALVLTRRDDQSVTPTHSPTPTPKVTVSVAPSKTPTPTPTATHTPTPTPTATATPTPPGNGGGSNPTPTPSPQIVDIAIRDFNFSPSTLNVWPGDTVRFTNDDSVAHSAVADGGTWSTPVLNPGQSYELHTASLPVGTYRYHCGIHGAGEAGTLRIRTF